MSNGGEAGRAWRDIAEDAYAAFLASLNCPLPTQDIELAAKRAIARELYGKINWSDLPDTMRIAWEAAVRHAANCSSRSEEIPHESMWAGWTPPV